MQWAEILQDHKLTRQIDLDLFQALYSFPKKQAYASQVGQLLGIPSSSLNLEVGRYAKRIATDYPVSFSTREDGSNQYWDFFFKGWDEGRYFVWQLRTELAEAMTEKGLAGEKPFAEEFPSEYTTELFEGAKKSIIVNSYERNPVARQQCIKHWGTCCSVCEFDFEETYGALGTGFIHVHHLTPIAQIGKAYQIDPIKDLRPVCPNCHAMLHKQEPPLGIDELKEIIQDNRL
jgi:5-methylcytosine-specific restriction protein A